MTIHHTLRRARSKIEELELENLYLRKQYNQFPYVLLFGMVSAFLLGILSGVYAAADRVVPQLVLPSVMSYHATVGPVGVQVNWREVRR